MHFFASQNLFRAACNTKTSFFFLGALPQKPPLGAAPPNPRLIIFYTLWASWKPYTGLLAALSAKCSAEKISKSLILLGLFISSQYFFFVTTRRTSSGSLRSMHLPHGIVCSLCTCLLKYPELWKVQVHTMRQGHWSSVSPGHRNLPSKVKKINRKKICKGKSSYWLQRGFVCSNTKYDLLERVLIYRFSEFLHSYMLHLMFTWEFVCSKALKMCGTLVLIYQYVLSYWMAQ